MKRLVIFLLTLACVAPVWAQGASIAQARELAQRLAQVQEFPNNVRLRFQVFAREADALEGNDDFHNLLRFFSDTRVMVWNRPVTPATEETMIQFEQQIVELSRRHDFIMDLPPVGYSPRGAARLISTERVTANGLSNLIVETERVATDMLQNVNSAELLFLRDNLIRLREDLSDRSVAPDSVRAVLGARARFLTLDIANRDPRLLTPMNRLAEALRGTFTPDRLRAGRQITL